MTNYQYLGYLEISKADLLEHLASGEYSIIAHSSKTDAYLLACDVSLHEEQLIGSFFNDSEVLCHISICHSFAGTQHIVDRRFLTVDLVEQGVNA